MSFTVEYTAGKEATQEMSFFLLLGVILKPKALHESISIQRLHITFYSKDK